MLVSNFKFGLLTKVAEVWSTCLFVGYVKFMPGTICSTLSLIILYFFDISYKKNLDVLLFGVVFIVSLYMVKIILEKINKKDPSFIVIDELLGIYLGALFCFSEKKILDYFLFLIFFRIFDIFKPFPINILDNLSKKGSYWFQSFFVIADDILASVFAICALKIVKAYLF